MPQAYAQWGKYFGKSVAASALRATKKATAAAFFKNSMPYQTITG